MDFKLIDLGLGRENVRYADYVERWGVWRFRRGELSAGLQRPRVANIAELKEVVARLDERGDKLTEVRAEINQTAREKYALAVKVARQAEGLIRANSALKKRKACAMAILLVYDEGLNEKSN